jgi:hypothetical protein
VTALELAGQVATLVSVIDPVCPTGHVCVLVSVAGVGRVQEKELVVVLVVAVATTVATVFTPFVVVVILWVDTVDPPPVK